MVSAKRGNPPLLWKTFRGLNSHKRSCHVLDIPDLKSLYEVSLQGTSDDIEESNEEDEEIDLEMTISR